MSDHPFSLAGHRFHSDPATPLAAVSDDHLYDYVVAANGVYLHATRPELEALVPLAPCQIRGLASLTPIIRLHVPRVPAVLVEVMLDIAREAATRSDGGVEVLFYLRYQNGWDLEHPPQRQTATSVVLDDGVNAEPYADALIDAHSHPFPLRRFSSTDDEADRGRFRFAALIADPAGRPSLHLRLAVYDVLIEVPAEAVFELPENLKGNPDEAEAPA